MRTTIALDDELLAKAEALTGLSEKSALVPWRRFTMQNIPRQSNASARASARDG